MRFRVGRIKKKRIRKWNAGNKKRKKKGKMKKKCLSITNVSCQWKSIGRWHLFCSAEWNVQWGGWVQHSMSPSSPFSLTLIMWRLKERLEKKHIVLKKYVMTEIVWSEEFIEN